MFPSKPIIVVFGILLIIILTTYLVKFFHPLQNTFQPSVSQVSLTEPIFPPPTLVLLTGSASVSFDQQIWSTLEDQAHLIPGQSVKTGPNSQAVIILPESSTVHLDQNTQVTLNQIHTSTSSSSLHYAQSSGQAWYSLQSNPPTQLSLQLSDYFLSASPGSSFNTQFTPDSLIITQFQSTSRISLPFSNTSRSSILLSANQLITLPLSLPQQLPTPTPFPPQVLSSSWIDQNLTLFKAQSDLIFDPLDPQNTHLSTKTIYLDTIPSSASGSSKISP